MDEQRLFRCTPDDPDRCQASHAQMQCPYLAQEGKLYCARHIAGDRGRQKEEIHNYFLTKFKARLESKIASPRIKTLTEEIGILRMTLEEVLNNCSNEFELVLYSNKITEIVSAIRMTLESSMKIEEKANLTLDKAQVTIVASRIIGIISSRVLEQDIKQVAEEIIKAFEVVI